MGGTKSITFNLILGLSSQTVLHTGNDNNQTRPQHTTQTHNKHHHHGGRAANPFGGVDLMNPHCPRDWWIIINYPWPM
jgi:hypothetical protein